MLKLTQIIKIAIILGIFLQTSQSYKLFDGRLQPEGRTKFDDDLREFMEFVKLQMQCGYEPAGVPPLAPYQQDFAKFDLQGGGWSLKGNLTNLVITGLNEFDIVELHWNNVLAKITFDFKFPSIWAHSDSYKLNAVTSMFGPATGFHGDGVFSLELINLRARGSFKLRPNLSGGLMVKGFNAKLELESSKSKTTGIMGGKLIYNKLFNSWIEEFINLTFEEDNSEAVSAFVDHLVVPPLDAALKNISLVELIALITGLAQDVVPTEAIC
uniref:Hemolymph juvenile hormone binding protein (JHBP) n=1 Tax=Musca domestica TaxID=7370 RepID=A0A1I8NG16_MUSDO